MQRTAWRSGCVDGWPNLPRSLGTKGWVLGSKCRLSLPRCASGMQYKGPGVSWPPPPAGAVGDASPAALVPNLALPPPLKYRAGERFKLSACRGKHGTVPTHTAVCCYPAALPPRPGPVQCGCTHPGSQTGVQFQPWEVEDTCKTVPLGGRREAKGVFMHRRPLQYIRPQTRPFANPQTAGCSIEGAIICFFVPIHFC